MKDGTEECAIERALQCVGDLTRMFPEEWRRLEIKQQEEEMLVAALKDFEPKWLRCILGIGSGADRARTDTADR